MESIGSSTRIEGAKLSDTEMKTLLSSVGKTSFLTRDEQEVAGYAEAMEMVVENYTDIPVTGYSYIPYASLESIVEKSKDAYYLSWQRTQRALHDDAIDWLPWLRFFLNALKRQKDHYDHRQTYDKKPFYRTCGAGLTGASW